MIVVYVVDARDLTADHYATSDQWLCMQWTTRVSGHW